MAVASAKPHPAQRQTFRDKMDVDEKRNMLDRLLNPESGKKKGTETDPPKNFRKNRIS